MNIDGLDFLDTDHDRGLVTYKELMSKVKEGDRPQKRIAWGWVILAAFVGSVVALLAEPRQGRRRRALVRDKAVHYYGTIKWQGRRKARDLRNRVRGLPYRISSEFHRDEIDVEDVVLVQRVRSIMGRKVSHPHAVRVEAENGTVTLSGQILSREVEALVYAVRRVPGVHAVINNLYCHEDSDHVSSLQ